jgi:hypothetical protein
VDEVMTSQAEGAKLIMEKVNVKQKRAYVRTSKKVCRPIIALSKKVEQVFKNVIARVALQGKNGHIKEYLAALR